MKLPRPALFLWHFIFAGFFLGTLTLMGPVRWVTGYMRGAGKGQGAERLAVGFLLRRTGEMAGGVQFAQAADDLATVVPQAQAGEVAGGMVVAQQVVVADADRPVEVLLLPAGEPIQA